MYVCICSARNQSLTHTRQALYHDGSISILSKLPPGPHNRTHQRSWRWHLSSWLTLKPWSWSMGPFASLRLCIPLPGVSSGSQGPPWQATHQHSMLRDSWFLPRVLWNGCGSWWVSTPALLPLMWDHHTPVNQLPLMNQIPGAGSANLLINAFVYGFLFPVSCP